MQRVSTGTESVDVQSQLMRLSFVVEKLVTQFEQQGESLEGTKQLFIGMLNGIYAFIEQICIKENRMLQRPDIRKIRDILKRCQTRIAREISGIRDHRQMEEVAEYLFEFNALLSDVVFDEYAIAYDGSLKTVIEDYHDRISRVIEEKPGKSALTVAVTLASLARAFALGKEAVKYVRAQRKETHNQNSGDGNNRNEQKNKLEKHRRDVADTKKAIQEAQKFYNNHSVEEKKRALVGRLATVLKDNIPDKLSEQTDDQRKKLRESLQAMVKEIEEEKKKRLKIEKNKIEKNRLAKIAEKAKKAAQALKKKKIDDLAKAAEGEKKQKEEEEKKRLKKEKDDKPKDGPKDSDNKKKETISPEKQERTFYAYKIAIEKKRLFDTYGTDIWNLLDQEVRNSIENGCDGWFFAPTPSVAQIKAARKALANAKKQLPAKKVLYEKQKKATDLYRQIMKRIRGNRGYWSWKEVDDMPTILLNIKLKIDCHDDDIERYIIFLKDYDNAQKNDDEPTLKKLNDSSLHNFDDYLEKKSRNKDKK